MSGAAGVLSAFGSARAGEAQQVGYNANARAEEQQGEVTRQASFNSADQIWSEVQRRLGSARAAYGAAGIDPNTGTPLLVMAESARRGELARQATLFQGRLNQEVANTQAAIDRFTGKAAKRAGYIQAGTTLLTTASGITKHNEDLAALAM